ncbi:MAG TPA: zinc-ribbon domain-containing protein [Terriglobales bacterium]|nr:zinc-ribbon domain-containing protein [Terriglobales bacterium]
MICPNCEAPMPDISAFCPACGVSVAETAGAVNSRDRGLGALAYVGLVPAIVLLLIPGLRDNRFVSFHSWQSVLFTIASALVGVVLKLLLMVLAIVPMVGFLLAWLLVGIGCMGIFILWIVLLVKAALGNYYQLPLIGPLAEQLAARADS